MTCLGNKIVKLKTEICNINIHKECLEKIYTDNDLFWMTAVKIYDTLQQQIFTDYNSLRNLFSKYIWLGGGTDIIAVITI